MVTSFVNASKMAFVKDKFAEKTNFHINPYGTTIRIEGHGKNRAPLSFLAPRNI
jgi:hypothetical protein